MGLRTWLHKFFYSDDEIVRVAVGLLEPEAEMLREILANEGVTSLTKVLDPIARSEGYATGTNVGIFVKQSDLARALEILEPFVGGGKLAQDAASKSHRRLSRRARRHPRQ